MGCRELGACVAFGGAPGRHAPTILHHLKHLENTMCITYCSIAQNDR